MKRTDWGILLAICTLGVVLRLVFLIAMRANWPGYDTPSIDALYHHLWAQRISSGNVLGGGPYFRAPFYPYFLALIYTLFGPNFTVVYAIQHFLGLATIVLTWLLTATLFSKKVAHLAALLVAINGVVIFFEGQLLLDTLTVVMYVAVVFLLVRSAQLNRGTWYFIWPGLATGILALTRPNILGVLPLFVLWLFLVVRSAWQASKAALGLILAMMVVILPVAARNYFIGKDHVLIASQGGINLYIGNNEAADGYTAILPGKGHTWQYSDAEFEAATALGMRPGTLKPSQVSDYYTKKAWEFMITKPAKFLLLTVKKLYLFWNHYEISNNNNLYFITRFVGLTWLPIHMFYLLGPFGLVGCILAFGADRKRWIVPIAVFGYMLTLVAFFVTDRFRLPVVPLLSIAAAWVIVRLVEMMAHRNYRSSVKIILALLVAGAISWSSLYGPQHGSDALAHFSLGNIYLKKGDYQAAGAEYRQAIAMAPCVPHAHTNLGVIAFYNGDTATARLEFEREIAACGHSGKALVNLSLLRRLNGDFANAYTLADSAVRMFPNFTEAHLHRLLAAFGTQDETLIRRACTELLAFFPDHIAAHYYYGQLWESHSQLDSAVVHYQAAAHATGTDLVAEYDLSEIYSAALPYGYDANRYRAQSLFRLGVISVMAGNFQDAVEHFRQARLLLPGDPDIAVNLALAYDHMGNLSAALREFQAALSIDSTNPVYYYDYALTLGKSGNYKDAEQMLLRAVTLKPDFAEAKQKLALLRQLLDQQSGRD